jgi:uncharacterized protein DUF6318
MIGGVSRTRAVFTASLVLSALAFAGCSDSDPEPKFAPPSSSAPTSPSTSSSSAAPALGPEDTVRAWVDAQNRALVTGDTSDMEALAAPDCRGCTDFSEPIRQVIADGGKYIGGAWAVDAAKARAGSNPQVTVDVAMSMAGGRTVPKDGAEPIPFSADKRIMVFKLVSEDSVLKLAFVGFVQ